MFTILWDNNQENETLLPVESELESDMSQSVVRLLTIPRFLLLFLAFQVGLICCQTKQLKIDTEKSQQWFKSAKTGDISSLTKLHSELNIPWDFRAQNGVTALMIASRYGQADLIQFLLEKKVEVNLYDQYGYNALSYTLYGPMPLAEKQRIAILLIENKADAFKEDHIQARPVLFLIENGLLEALTKILWTQQETCDQAKQLGPHFSLVNYALEHGQDNAATFFKDQNCP